MVFTNSKRWLVASVIATGVCSNSYALTLTGNSSSAINGSDDAFVYQYDTSTLSLNSGADVAFLETHNNAQANIYSGSQLSFLNTYDASVANVYGGDTSWLILHDQSQVNVYKTVTSWLLVAENATATIFGSNFNYSNGHLSGNWSDGSAFSFRALNAQNDGQINFNADQSILPSNIILTSVPLPGAFYLFASTLFGLIGFLRKKS